MNAPMKSLYFIGFIFSYLIVCVLWLMNDHGDIVLWINSRRTLFFDQSMPLITFFGDGIFYAIISLSLVAYRWRLGLFFAMAGVVQAIVSAFLKRAVFGKVPRPIYYFEELGIDLKLIENFDYAKIYSFPSGHTMTVFLWTALLSMTIVPKRWHFALLALAILTGLSRIYLLQHFLSDVIAGAFTGVFLAIFFARYIYPRWFLEK
jgi:membrane-associated phospholipid phosphatase